MFLKNNFKTFLLISVFLFVGGNVFAGTFGYQDDGEGTLSSSYSINNQISGSKFYLSEKGEIQSISAKINFQASGKIKAGIYDNGDNLVAEATEIIEGSFPTTDWYIFTFSQNPVLEIGNYWLVVWANGSSDTIFLFLENSSTLESYQSTSTYNGLPSSITPAWFNTENSAIYATYRKPIVIISADFATSTLAYAGQLFTDLSAVIILSIGLPLGFAIVVRIIEIWTGREYKIK